MTKLYSISPEYLKERLNSINITKIVQEGLGLDLNLSRINDLRSGKNLHLLELDDTLEQKFYKVLNFKFNSINPSITEPLVFPLVLTGVKSKDTFSSIMASSLNKFYEEPILDLNELEKNALKLDMCASLVAWWYENISFNFSALQKSTKMRQDLYFQSAQDIHSIEKNTSVKPIIDSFKEITLNSSADSLESQNLFLAVGSLDYSKNKAQAFLAWENSKTLDFDWEISPSYLDTSWSDLEYSLKKCKENISSIVNVDSALLVLDENYLSFAKLFISSFQGLIHKDSYSAEWNMSDDVFKKFGTKENLEKCFNLFLCDARFKKAIEALPDLGVKFLAALTRHASHSSYNSSKATYNTTSAQNIIDSIWREVVSDTSIISKCDVYETTYLSQKLSPAHLAKKEWEDFILNKSFKGKKLKNSSSIIKSYWELYEKNKSEELFLKMASSLSEHDLDSVGYRGIESFIKTLTKLEESKFQNVISSNPHLLTYIFEKINTTNSFISYLSAKSEKLLDFLWALAIKPQAVPTPPNILTEFQLIPNTRRLLFSIFINSEIEKFKTPDFLNVMLTSLGYAWPLKEQKFMMNYIINNKEVLVPYIKAKAVELDSSIIPSAIFCQKEVLTAFSGPQVLQFSSSAPHPVHDLKTKLTFDEQKKLITAIPQYYSYCSLEVKKDIDCTLKYLTIFHSEKSGTSSFSSSASMSNVHPEYWSDPGFCAKVAQECGLEVFKNAKTYINPQVWSNKNFALKIAALIDKMDPDDDEEYNAIIATAPPNVKKFFAALDLKPGRMVAVLESCFLKKELVNSPSSASKPAHKI